MGKTILKGIGVVLGILLVPYFLTLLVTGGLKESPNQEASQRVNGTSLAKPESVGDQTVDQYIRSVLATYVPLELNMETMKAMAVIVRTNVYYKWQEKGMASITNDDIGLPTTTNDSIVQKYGEEKAASYISTLENVVYSTRDSIISYNEQPILACYHYTNAGKTRNYGETTGNPLPYLISVDSSHDVEASVGITTVKLTYTEVASMLENSFSTGKLDPQKVMEQVAITKQDSTGYVIEVCAGQTIISGEQFQQCFGLNSTNFYFTEFEGNLRIICRGQGSGYGFSQYGANVLAGQGMTFDQLIAYYYPGTAISAAS